MTQSSNEFLQDSPRLTKSELYERATALAVDMALFADGLSAASCQALASTISLQAVAQRGNGWPLSNADMVQSAVQSQVETLVHGKEVIDSIYQYGNNFWGNFKYYDHHDLAGMYDPANLRSAFVADVRRWTNAMAETSWPMIVEVNAAPTECVVLSVFDETPAVKTFLQGRVDGSAREKGCEDEALIGYGWIDPRLLIFGDVALIEECKK